MADFIRLSRINKLVKSQQFRSVFRSSRRSGDGAFLVIARKNSNNVARLGMSLPKKHVNQAVQRNRIKRVIRESFGSAQALLKGLDVVVVVLKGTDNNFDNKSLRSKLEQHWKKVSACKKSC